MSDGHQVRAGRPGRGSSPRRAQRVLVASCPDWPPPDEDPPQVRGEDSTASSAGPRAAVSGQLIAVVEEFCPQAEVLHPGACAIAAQGPARYFGGEAELARRIRRAAARRGLACRTGIADGMFAALLAAGILRSGARFPALNPSAAGVTAAGVTAAGVTAAGVTAAGVTIVSPGAAAAFLAPFPVAVLEIPELDHLLPRLGITTLGQFAALPAAQAASRFGTAGSLAHRMARGLDPRPLMPRPLAADLSAVREFDPPAGQSEPVVFAAKTLADQLLADLSARGLTCVRIRVQVRCADGREITRLWRHDGLLSPAAVAERVRWQLDGWRPGQGAPERGIPERGIPERGAPGQSAPGETGRGEPPAGDRSGAAAGRQRGGALIGGIISLRMIPDQLVRNHGRQLGLWGEEVVSDRVARAAARVQAMLGHGAVTRPVLAGGRSPAGQVLLVPFGDTGPAPLPAGRPWPGSIPAPAPVTVYPDPISAMVSDGTGAPVSVTGRARVSGAPARLSVAGGPPLEITSWAGPWPVTERWWDPGRARRLARFQFVTGDGNGWLVVLRDGHWLIEAAYH